MKRITLYHISYDLTQTLEKEFFPRVPESTTTDEDETIPRICLSDSIEGCINAAEDKLKFYYDDDYAKIIVWEKEFILPNDRLKCWQQLYKDNLVPDAELTHEYWCLYPLKMEGSYYEISDVKEAVDNKKLVYIIKHKYREKVFEILSRHGMNTDIVKDMDMHTIVNEWISSTAPEKYDDIIDDFQKEIRIVDKSEIDESLYEHLFSSPSEPVSILDIDPQEIYCDLKIRKSS